jgi:hypothetical protein
MASRTPLFRKTTPQGGGCSAAKTNRLANGPHPGTPIPSDPIVEHAQTIADQRHAVNMVLGLFLNFFLAEPAGRFSPAPMFMAACRRSSVESVRVRSNVLNHPAIRFEYRDSANDTREEKCGAVKLEDKLQNAMGKCADNEKNKWEEARASQKV